MKVWVAVIMTPVAAVLIAACAQDQPEAVAKQQGHTPSAPSIDCEVTSGPNKGEKGKRTEDGWCEGDWGGTECRPRSKCKDIPATGLVAVAEPLEAPDFEVDPGTDSGNAVVGIVPPHGSPPHEYCQREDDLLSVVFANTGARSSPDGEVVTVTFATASGGERQNTRPAIPAGGTVEMIYEIPDGCFDADCEFLIEWSNQPAVEGICIG